jgi:hypothetical protein
MYSDYSKKRGVRLTTGGLAKQGFSNIEPIDCKNLYAAARKLATGTSQKQFDATVKFLSQCMSGIRKAEFVEAVASKKAGRARGKAAFGDLIEHGLALQDGAHLRDCLALIEGFSQLSTTYVFRRQMFSAMRSALRMTVDGECADLSDAVWQVQNWIRHAGRNIAYRSVGSTLLVKGLQFANAVVVHSESMNRNDWYVALTRATHTLTVLSPLRRFAPPA